MTVFSRLAAKNMTVFVPLLASLLFLLSCQKQEEVKREDQEKRTWKLTMIAFEELRQTRDAEKGFREGLAAAGLQEVDDYIIVKRNAQGDNGTVLSMIDATSTDGTDMIISLQTSTLEPAVKRGEGVPIVFMVVANPFVISTVGQSDTDHLPYLTGVYTNTTFESMMHYIRKVLPDARSIGTLFNPDERNAVFYKNGLLEAGANAGLTVETYGVNYKTSVPQATQSLINRGIDAICQIEDNMTSATFSSIMKVARENRVPVFSFVNEQAEQGSIIVVAPDYTQGARMAASYVARIMRGESPEDIPLGRITKFDHIVNLDAAREFGLTIPQDIIDRADIVLEGKE
ncbi:MAG: ABC transporter substrate-binding protein [Bacteroidetes bacterium]|nr:ABC transporter substrate-binding protein [Bacteroidota bacterium]